MSTGLCAAAVAATLAVPYSVSGQEMAAVLGAASLTAQAITSNPPDAAPPKKVPNPIEDQRDRVYYPGDTESVKPLTIKLAGNILLDQKQIWTSPFHMNRRNAKWWILFGGATAGLIASDHYLQHRIEHSSSQLSTGNYVSDAGAVYTVLPEVAAFYTIGVVADKETARETGVLGAEALLDSLIVQEVLKTAAGRNRPDSPKEPGEFFDGGASFPSGHAIESWSLAAVIASEYHAHKWVPVLVYGLAGAISVARYSANRHYASDLVCGGAMGWFIGRSVYRTHMDHGIHRHPAAFEPRIVPQLQPGSGTYAVALAWGR